MDKKLVAKALVDLCEEIVETHPKLTKYGNLPDINIPELFTDTKNKRPTSFPSLHPV